MSKISTPITSVEVHRKHRCSFEVAVHTLFTIQKTQLKILAGIYGTLNKEMSTQGELQLQIHVYCDLKK